MSFFFHLFLFIHTVNIYYICVCLFPGAFLILFRNVVLCFRRRNPADGACALFPLCFLATCLIVSLYCVFCSPSIFLLGSRSSSRRRRSSVKYIKRLFSRFHSLSVALSFARWRLYTFTRSFTIRHTLVFIPVVLPTGYLNERSTHRI